MVKKRYKLKPDVFLYLAVIIVIIIFINKGINYYKTTKYHKTTEYKLISSGYSKKDIKILEKHLNEKELTKLSKSKKDEKLLKLMENNRYIHDNLNEYLEYQDLNQNKTIDEVINEVNLHLNYAYYEKTYEADLSKGYAVLVNRYYHLDENYEPEDLEVISTKYAWGQSGSQKIRKEALEEFIKMHEDAESNNIYLMVNGSYRSYNKQEQLFNSYKISYGEAYAEKYVAKPGFSERQTGLTLDILSITDPLQATFKESETYKWLHENSYKYGFIERYQEEKENITGFANEPWHYRYVGMEAAKYIYENNITLDEYYIYNAK